MASSQPLLLSDSPIEDGEKRSLFWRKWLGFVSAIWVMVFSASYSFSNYSEELKEVLAINQESLNRLGIARDLGDALAGIVAGYLSIFLPPWVLLCFSGLASVVGFGVQFLVVSQTIDPLPYWIMIMAIMIGGTVMSWMNSAVFNASVRNFKRSCGPVAGLLKACMGLSGAVFATICSALFASSASMYLMMVVTVPTMFCFISAIFFRPVPSASTPQEEKVEQKSLTAFNVIAVALAIYIAVVNILPDSLNNSSAYKYTAVTVLIVIIASPGLVPITFFMLMKNSELSQTQGLHDTITSGEKEEKEQNYKENSEDSSADGHDCDDSLGNKGQDDIEKNGMTEPLTDMKRSSSRREGIGAQGTCCGYPLSSFFAWLACGVGEETPTLTLFKRWHAWAMFLSLVIGCGTGVSFSNNLGQIGQAFGFDNVSSLISLFSLGNFFGRLAAGNVSEYFIRMTALPRTAWMGLAKVPMIALNLLLSGGSGASLYGGSLVIGFSHGSLITLVIPTVSEFYGLKHFGTNFVVMSLFFITGSLSMSSISGRLYDEQAAKQTETESLMCYGSQCYGPSFLIFASFLTLGLGFDILLSIASKQVYQNIRAERLNLAG